MRVLFIDQYARLGGGQRMLIDTVLYFREQGHQVEVALPETGPVTEAFQREGVTVRSFRLGGMQAGKKPFSQQLGYLLTLRRAGRRIEQIAQEFKADLIYSNGPRATLPVMLATRKTLTPVVATVHMIFGGREKRLLDWCFKQKQLKRAVFCSSAAAKPFESWLQTKGEVVWNWVSPEFLERGATREESRCDLGLKPNDVAIGVLGRVSANKGQRLLIEGLLPVLSDHPNWRILIAGGSDWEDPNEEEDLRRQCSGNPQVRFLGNVRDAPAFLDALDIQVVPTVVDESFGLVAAEGMARRLPVVCTRSGGMVEVVADSETGYVVEKIPGAIREKVRMLAEDGELRRRLGEAGRKRVEELFSPKARLPHLLSICEAAARK